MLLDCNRDDPVVAELLQESNNEQAALRRIWPPTAAGLVGAPLGALPVACIGGAVGSYIDPPPEQGCELASNDILVGSPVGCVLGAGIGAVIGTRVRAGIVARRRVRVNDLVRRSNRVIASPP